jgi:putative hydrolase of the HAD superfamily
MFAFFDIDETLVNQREAEAAAAHQLLAAYGNLLERSYSLPEFCRLWRFFREKHNMAFFARQISLQEQRRRRIRELFARDGKALSDTEADVLIEFYEHHYRNSWNLFDDVMPFFESFSGTTCGIISNGSTEQQKRKLYQTGIERYFEVIVVSEEAGAAKPQSEIFLAACHQARCAAQQCIYVGDRLKEDALASSAVGMRAFWLDRKNSRTHLKVEVINSLAELSWKLESRVAV